MHNDTFKSEYDVENEFIKTITTNWFKYNRMSTYEEIEANFRSKLNLINEDVLEGVPLSDDEFRNVLLYMKNKSIFESSQILRGGKISVFSRAGKIIYLKLVNLEDIEKNIFEVARQISVRQIYTGRFDVTLLINGIPFVQVELKKPGVEINEAFNQVMRYKKDNCYTGLFNYIQLFVISNDANTRYFCNNDSTHNNRIKKSHCFVWTDIDNTRINKLHEFEKSFLFCPFIFKVIFEYMIASASEKKLFVMRPYQIYAYKALKETCLKQNKDGYCFHSTGSGKTLTSFKFAYEMSKNKDIDFVFFLVDRKDLDDKTVSDFNSYMSSTSNQFMDVKDTESLINEIEKNNKLIIATINKMSIALNNKNRHRLAPYKNSRVIFIFDECHRSQAGNMRKDIQKFFSNARYYGFTGTPIFTSEDEKSENARQTSLYFGKPVHTYTLKEAIGDRNVLPLCIEYVNVIKKKDDIKNEYVEGLDYKEVMTSEKRAEIIRDNILENFQKKSKGKAYNAIFACESIKQLIANYKAFLQKSDGLVIAAIYSYNPNEDMKEGDDINTAKDELAMIINEYNNRPENKTNFSINTYESYESEVIRDFRHNKIDILFVVDKCLTGMDFVLCNTLYLDKPMKMHGLIQAISRTIRTSDISKDCGNIISYQVSKKTMNDALKHFNNDVDVYNDINIEPLEDLIIKLNESFAIAKANKKLANSRSEKDRLFFVKTFRELMRCYTKANNYIDFDVNNTDVDMQTYFEMQSLYKDIYNEIKPVVFKESFLKDVDFEIELIERVIVNFDYISELLVSWGQGQTSAETTMKRIKKALSEITEKSKRELIRKFIDSFMERSKIGLYEDVEKAYESFVNDERNKALRDIAEKFDVDLVALTNIIEKHSFYQDELELNKNVAILLQDQHLTVEQRIKKIKEMPNKVKAFFDLYDDITIF